MLGGNLNLSPAESLAKDGKMMDVRPVLIGNFGPPTLACIRSWGEKGCKVGFICVASHGTPLPRSKYLESVVVLSPEKRFRREGLEEINRFLEKFDATGLISISEGISNWLYEQRKYLPVNVALWLNNSENLINLLSKKSQIEMARAAGFDVLPTYYIKNIEQDVEQIDAQDYPLCLRPTLPEKVEPSFKVKFIESKRDLIAFLNTINKIEAHIIAQPFLVLPNVNVHASRSASGNLFGHNSFLVERKFKGVSLTFQPFEMSDNFYQKCSLVASKLEAVGPFDIEFLYDEINDKVYFIELNNRFGGATAKAFACGYDEPYYALLSYGVDCGKPRKIRKVQVVSRQAVIKCMLATLKNELTPFDYPIEPSYKRILFLMRAFFSHYDDVFSFQDIKGSLSLYYINFKSKIIGS